MVMSNEAVLSEMSNEEILSTVMAKFEEFFMGDGPESGEQIFNNWA